MTKIVRVWYRHQERQNVKNTYVDFKLLPNQEYVEKIELRDVIPEHTELEKTFVTDGSSKENQA